MNSGIYILHESSYAVFPVQHIQKRVYFLQSKILNLAVFSSCRHDNI